MKYRVDTEISRHFLLCLRLGSLAKEVWVRVAGLPLHCWSGEVLKKIGDCCGGFVEVDDETKSFSQL